jgi:adenosylcobinamide kinase/adenosylcobinamide-phosphate guanylyltransferase
MITFISGSVRSGKSSFAEQMIKNKSNKVYLATSYSIDSEMDERIKKHQEDRKQDGYKTIEKPYNLNEIVDELSQDDVVLLDCLTNLVANEMYLNQNNNMDKIIEDLNLIEEKVHHLVIVSNDVFSSGLNYDLEVKKYMKNLGYLHVLLTQLAEHAYELVYKLPIKRK